MKIALPHEKGRSVYVVKPNDVLDLGALNLKGMRVDLVGSDIVLTDQAAGKSVVLAQMALYMFSPDDAPRLVAAGHEIDPQALMASVGKVWEFTAQDFLGITSMEKLEKEQDPQQTQQQSNLAEKVKMVEVAAELQQKIQAVKAATVQPLSEDNKKFDELLDRPLTTKTGDGDYATPPKVTIDKPEKHIDESPPANNLTFTFDVQLLQPGPVTTVLSSTQDRIDGGGAFETAVYDARNVSQFSQEIIDVSAGSKPSYVIYTDNPDLFDASTATRVLTLTPFLPDGFVPSKLTINGVPAGISIAGATDTGGGVWEITSPTLDGGLLKLNVTYPTTAPQSFHLQIDFEATFDASTGLDQPATGTVLYTLERDVDIKTVNDAEADGNYLDTDGKLVWVMADNPNSNKVLAGDKTVTVYGGYGVDEVYAGAGNDTLYGGAGNDILSAGAGNDWMQGGAGNDVLVGGAGTDTADYADKSQSVSVDLAVLDVNSRATVSVNGVAEDLLEAVESITGGSGNDTLYGDAGANVLAGGGSDDVLMGRGGNDVLDGGGGIDTVSYIYASNGVTVTLSGGGATVNVAAGDVDTLSGIENINGTNYADILTGDANANILRGDGGSDIFYLSGGADVIDGGSSVDTFYLTAATAGVTLDMASVNGSGYSTLTYGAVTQTVREVENLTGSAYGDTLSGDTLNNTLYGMGGDDTLDGGGGDDVIYGGTGADTLHGGTGSNTLRFNDLATAVNVVMTGAGEGTADDGTSTDTFDGFGTFYLTDLSAQGDTFTESTGADIVYGLSGDDTFTVVAGDSADDTFNGGNGTDTVDYSSASNPVTVSLAAGTATGNGNDTLTSIENVIGTSGDDTISGSTSSNTLDGGGGTNTLSYAYTNTAVTLNLGVTSGGYATATIGSDTDRVKNFSIITGGGGNDVFTGSGSGQTFNGGLGNDTFNGSLGADTFNGDGGTDTVSYSALSNAVTLTLQDTTGNATVGFAGLGKTDTLTGIENITGSTGDDDITGNSSANILRGGNGADILHGMGGSDTLYGDAGNDEIHGGDGNDTITGGTGNDTLYGDDGDDVFIGDTGDDVIDGGIGTNTIDYSAQSGNLVIDLRNTNGTGAGGTIGTDTLTSIQNARGGTGNDTFYGSSANNTFTGGGGSDTVYASDGSDTITGVNTISYASYGGSITANLAGASIQKDVGANGSVDYTDSFNGVNVSGSGYADTITGSSASNVLSGNGGDDIFYASAGNDTIDGGSGTDTLYYNNISGTINANLYYGTVSKSASSQTDSISSIEKIYAGNSADAFTLAGNNLASYTLIDAGGGTDTVTTVAGTLGVEAAGFDSVFNNVEILDLRNSTLSGGDSFNVYGADVVGLSSNRTLSIYVSSGFNVSTLAGGGYSITSDVTNGSTRTVVFNNGSNATLNIVTYS